MRINQVEELAGITKKNIRFYEAQGLLSPQRNSENGYREYSIEDVEQLKRIKLLRKLDISCEQIRNMAEGKLSLEDCVRRQQRELEKRRQDLEWMQELCSRIGEGGERFESLDASGLLHEIKTLEKGGVKFMDTGRSDVKKRRRGAVVSALAAIAFIALTIILILWGNSQDPAPLAVLLFVVAILAVIIVGIVLALRLRIKELKGGELDEAGKY